MILTQSVISSVEQIGEMGLVSIIIPVYNAEHYIELLLSSVYEQTYQNFEVIVAYEDASTDDSLYILSQLQKKYHFILSTGSERCPGGTRNRGLSYATGEFVVFVDADDYLMPEYLSSMLYVFAQYPTLSVVSCDCHTLSHSEEVLPLLELKGGTEFKIEMYDAASMIQRIIDRKQPMTPWIWMIRRDYLLQNNIRFPTKYYGEDDVFSYLIVTHTSHVGLCRNKVYCYINRPSSLSQSKKKYWYDPLQSACHYIPGILKTNYPQYALEYTNVLNRLVVSCSALELSHTEFMHYLSEKNIRHLSLRKRAETGVGFISVCLFNISPLLYFYALNWFRSSKFLLMIRKK